MKKNEIKVGGHYRAKVNGALTTVRVDAIRESARLNGPVRTGWLTPRSVTIYSVTNLRTGRKLTFRSAAKFRCEVPAPTLQVPNTTGPTPAFTATQGFVPNTDCDPAREAERDAREVEETESTEDDMEGEQSRPFAVTEPLPSPTAASVGASSPECRSHAAVAAVSLASRIAATCGGRVVGSPVAGMTPNEEQEAILATAAQDGLRVLVVAAGAGTGKTATLKMLEQVLQGNGQYTAFNTSLVAESKAKFVKAACNTTHALAFRAVGKPYQHRLGGERMRSSQIARILGIEPFMVTLKGAGEPIDEDSYEWCEAAEKAGYDSDNPPPDNWAPESNKTKVLQAEFLAGQVLVAIRKFCQSADREVGPQHFHYIAGIDQPRDADQKGGEECWHNNNLVRDYLLPFTAKAWADLTNVNGQLPFQHDHYVKLWQLGTGDDRPIIAADYILLDEAQDTAPVFLDIIRQQTHALLVLVGDSNQSIYEWRGAVDAMKTFPNAPRRLLSQSYRFGQAVADVANAVLGTLEEPTDLVMKGMPTIPSRVAAVAAPRCYLYRTNAGAVSRVMTAIRDKKRPHLIGGGADVVAWCQAAMDLQARRGTRHPELCCFETWSEVEEYSKTDEGGDLRLMVKLVTDFGAKDIRDALKDMPKETEADLVVSTAHKSKGREWDTVKLGPDFPTANKMTDADRRLLYVAATRAKETLDITECPPFCGGRSGIGEQAEWIPGIPVCYTQDQPTEAEQATWKAAKDAPSPAIPAPVAPVPNGEPRPTNGNGAKGEFTFAKWSDRWCIRGKGGVAVGTKVTVTRRNGTSSTETIRSVVKVFADATIYGV